MAQEREWFYVLHGEIQGPLSSDDFWHLFASRSLPLDTRVWTEGVASWVPAGEVAWLRERLPCANGGIDAGLQETGEAAGVVRCQNVNHQESQSPPQTLPLNRGTPWLKAGLLGCGGIIAVLLAGILVVGIILVTQRPGGSTGDGSPRGEGQNQAVMRAAIERVLAAHHELSARLGNAITPETKKAEAFAGYGTALMAFDLTECPPEFREAFTRYSAAWEAFALQLAKEPQSFEEGVLQGFFNALGGEADGGTARMQRARDARFEHIQSTWVEVQAIAARYGAKLSAQ